VHALGCRVGGGRVGASGGAVGLLALSLKWLPSRALGRAGDARGSTCARIPGVAKYSVFLKYGELPLGQLLPNADVERQRGL